MSIKSQILYNLRASLNENSEEHKIITDKLETDANLLNAFVNLRRELDSIASRFSETNFGNGYSLPIVDVRKKEQEYEEKKIIRRSLGKKALEQLSSVEELIREKFGLEENRKPNKVRSPFGGSIDIGDDEVDDTFDKFDNEDDED
jgi:hypothetical protein